MWQLPPFGLAVVCVASESDSSIQAWSWIPHSRTDVYCTFKPQMYILLAFNFDVASHAASHQVHAIKWNYGVVSSSGGIAFSLFAKIVINSVLGIGTEREKNDKNHLHFNLIFQKLPFRVFEQGKGLCVGAEWPRRLWSQTILAGFTPQGKQHPNNRGFRLFGFEAPLGIKSKTNKPTKRMWHSRMTL